MLSGGSSPYACGERGAEAAAAHPAARSTTPATRRSRHHVDRLRYEPLNTDRSNNEQSEALSLAKGGVFGTSQTPWSQVPFSEVAKRVAI